MGLRGRVPAYTSRFELSVTPDMKRRLLIAADARGVSVAEVVREAVDAYLPKSDRRKARAGARS